MSSANSPARRFECHHPDCESERTSSQYGSFCSDRCKTRHVGLKALRNIKHDHRFCATCYKPLKTIYRPADRESAKLRTKAVIIRDSFVGYQELTEFAKRGGYGLECSCGNVGHYHTEQAFQEGEPYEWFLKLAFEKFRKEGQIDDRFCIETFCNEFWRSEDLEFSVGKALK